MVCSECGLPAQACCCLEPVPWTVSLVVTSSSTPGTLDRFPPSAETPGVAVAVASARLGDLWRPPPPGEGTEGEERGRMAAIEKSAASYGGALNLFPNDSEDLHVLQDLHVHQDLRTDYHDDRDLDSQRDNADTTLPHRPIRFYFKAPPVTLFRPRHFERLHQPRPNSLILPMDVEAVRAVPHNGDALSPDDTWAPRLRQAASQIWDSDAFRRAPFVLEDVIECPSESASLPVVPAVRSQIPHIPQVPQSPHATHGQQRAIEFQRGSLMSPRPWSPTTRSSTTKGKLMNPLRTIARSLREALHMRSDAHDQPQHEEVGYTRFFYPQGKPILPQHLDLVLKKVAAAFDNFPNQQVPRHQFGVITKACDCPLYWKIPLFIACGGDKAGYVDVNSFLDYWRNLCSSCHNPASRFISILTRGQRQLLLPEDFIPLVQDVVETHPGLTFLKEATEFHSRYVHTVIARIYYCVNRSWSGRISLAELRRSNLLSIIKLLEDEDDINAITQYFSYEHFYVIYCKFWELDRDHDLFIDRHDLARHSDHALSSRLIDRIFSGAVTRGGRHKLREDRMSYTEFVWFLLSEEDKAHPTAIEYWFRCMDLDGDGYLSMYELEYFYEEQLQRMDAIGIETLPFEDCLCQMLDMIRPEIPGKISLSDLKRCKMTSIFFDTFFNLEKYLDHEQRDPFASQRDHDNEGRELSDWDRYAAEEYELLVAEEGGQDPQEDLIMNGDREDLLSPNLDKLSWPSRPTFKVTDFDLDLGELDGELGNHLGNHLSDEDDEDEDSDDYAGDSDEEDEEGSI